MASNIQKVLAETLASVNKTRAAFTLNPLKKMPKGRLSDCHRCPLAKALKDCGITGISYSIATTKSAQVRQVLQKAWGKNVYTTFLRIPRIFQRFVSNFDNKKYPELLKE